MKSNQVLQLGNPTLHLASRELTKSDKGLITEVVKDLQDILAEFKAKYGKFRAIAAPQVGQRIRLIYLHLEKPHIIINPVLKNLSEEKMELWDDCMCFPNLMVKVKRHKTCTLDYVDENFRAHSKHLRGDWSELIQHEHDHLEGTLATQRALNLNSFKWFSPNEVTTYS